MQTCCIDSLANSHNKYSVMKTHFCFRCYINILMRFSYSRHAVDRLSFSVYYGENSGCGNSEQWEAWSPAMLLAKFCDAFFLRTTHKTIYALCGYSSWNNIKQKELHVNCDTAGQYLAHIRYLSNFLPSSKWPEARCWMMRAGQVRKWKPNVRKPSKDRMHRRFHP